MSESITPYFPIGDISGKPKVINVKGRVIYTSGIEHWMNDTAEGHKMAFDIADSTGKIRVFVWQEAADEVNKLIQRGQTVALKNIFVDPVSRQYNNLDHPFELNLHSVEQINVLENDSVEVTEEEAVFTPYEEVKSEKHPEFTYFDVSGEIVRIGELRDGFNLPKNDTLRLIDISDGRGNVLHVASWNEYIPKTELAVGKMLRVNRGKYVRDHGELKSTGAQIEIDGERII